MGNTLNSPNESKKSIRKDNMKIELKKKGYYPKIKSKSFNEFQRTSHLLMDSSIILNIRIIGLSGAGKTALIHRFVMNQFVNDYHSTLTTTSTKELNLQGLY
jgi:putative ribosome biogenesis GTPase RsgA